MAAEVALPERLPAVAPKKLHFATSPNTYSTVSFSGAGWFVNYELGAAAALRDVGIITSDVSVREGATRCVGASGGSLVATWAALEMSTDSALALVREMYDVQAADWRKRFCLDDLVQHSLARLEPEILSAAERWKQAHGKMEGYESLTWQDMVRGRLGVYFGIVSWRFPFLREAVRTDFATIDDLKESLTASCSLPLLANLRRLQSSPAQLALDGAHDSLNHFPAGIDPASRPIAVDGGLRNLQPEMFEPGVLVVSPFWWQLKAHVRPRYLPSLWSLFPPEARSYHACFAFGYCDALDFAVSSGVITPTARDELKLKHPSTMDPEVQAMRPSPIPHWTMTGAVCGGTFMFARSAARVVFRRRPR
jgi:hypothetical protein